jgi:hypothetical protein
MKNTNRFSRHAFGGGETGELAANGALAAHHERLLTPGTAVRTYRGPSVSGVVVGQVPGRCLLVEDCDGLRWELETRNLEVQT